MIRRDEDNRLTTAETSRDGIVWERDGRYDYYTHGALERLLYGEDEVQGLDYVHTIQGWLKAINHSRLEPTQEAGRDGWMSGAVPVGNTARDVWGMQLTYFQDDYIHSWMTGYESNSGNGWHLDPASELGYQGLYNGNISAWTWRWDNHLIGTISGLQVRAARGAAYRGACPEQEQAKACDDPKGRAQPPEGGAFRRARRDRLRPGGPARSLS